MHLDTEKSSQRILENTFNSIMLKAWFGLGEEEKVRRDSISEQLAKIDSNYFKESMSRCMDDSQIYMKNLNRVDNTIVADTCSKLKYALNQKSGKTLVKFSFSFDGILSFIVKFLQNKKIISRRQYSYELSKKKKNIMMKDFEEKYPKYSLKKNRKFEEIEYFIETESPIKWNN